MTAAQAKPSANLASVFEKKPVKALLLALILAFYLSYLGFILVSGRGPVDYETFMRIGQSWLDNQPVYGENSYYPLPYVLIFAFFAWLPRSISMILWFLGPILLVLIIHRGNPGPLLFAPVISHFLGGQTALPAMLGLWGYRTRQEPDRFWGGVWLGIITLKPQLAVFPLLWALIQWVKHIRACKRIPAQAWGFLTGVLVIYLPSFLLRPGWVNEWLSAPRPLFERALAGLLPRGLLYVFDSSSWIYWLVWLLGAAAIAVLIGWLSKWKPSFDLFLAASFLINPLAHDYDLIQLVPLLEGKRVLRTALLISIPAVLVILFAYQIDHAWFVYTLIPLALVWVIQKQPHTTHPPAPLP